jgi:hypothetical protein
VRLPPTKLLTRTRQDQGDDVQPRSVGGLSEDAVVAEHDDTSEPAAVPRVIDRLRAAGLSEDRIQQHFQSGAVRLDGQQVTDLDQPAPPPARLVIDPS